MARLSDRVVLVTGAAGGIGEAIVQRLVAEGASVVVADRDEVKVAALAKSVDSHARAFDVAIEAQWVETIDWIAKTFGRLDGLVNNAGINKSNGGETPVTVELADLRAMFAVNFEGVALGCKHAIGLMAAGSGGSIVNMSSIAGLLPADFIAAYGASKAAVAHWTKSVALHCARQGQAIRCNSVHPGSVMTPMMSDLFVRMAAGSGATPEQMEQDFRKRIPLGFYQSPEDIANAVLFLLSAEARAITGIELVVDGGMMLAN